MSTLKCLVCHSDSQQPDRPQEHAEFYIYMFLIWFNIKEECLQTDTSASDHSKVAQGFHGEQLSLQNLFDLQKDITDFMRVCFIKSFLTTFNHVPLNRPYPIQSNQKSWSTQIKP